MLCYVANGWDWPSEKRQVGPDGYYDGPNGWPARGLVKIEQVPRPTDTIFLTEANKDNLGERTMGQRAGSVCAPFQSVRPVSYRPFQPGFCFQ